MTCARQVNHCFFKINPKELPGINIHLRKAGQSLFSHTGNSRRFINVHVSVKNLGATNRDLRQTSCSFFFKHSNGIFQHYSHKIPTELSNTQVPAKNSPVCPTNHDLRQASRSHGCFVVCAIIFASKHAIWSAFKFGQQYNLRIL